MTDLSNFKTTVAVNLRGMGISLKGTLENQRYCKCNRLDICRADALVFIGEVRA